MKSMRFRGATRQVLVWAAAAMLAGGCAPGGGDVSAGPAIRPGAASRPVAFASPVGPIDRQALEDDLRSFQNAFQSLIESTTESIAESARNPEVQRACVLWRSRVLTEVGDAIATPDSVIALMEVWATCLRMANYLAGDEGRKLLGPRQDLAVEASRQALAMVESVADKHLAPSQREAAGREIAQYAGESPYRDAFNASSSQPLRLNKALVSRMAGVLGLPLAPLVTAQKIGQGVDTIRDWAPAVNRLTDVVEDYPRSVRWQADRLMLDLDRTPSFQLAVQSVNRISDSADQLSRTVSDFQPIANRYAELIQTLPADTASRAEQIMAALDRNQTARSAARSLDRISASSEQLIAAAQSLPASLQQALDRSSQSAGLHGRDLVDHAAWRSTQLLILAAVLAGGLVLLNRFTRRPVRHAR